MQKRLIRIFFCVLLAAALTGQVFAAAAQHEAYIGGFPDGTVRPEQTLTRAQLAQVLYRMAEPSAREELDRHETCFSDVSPAHWAYRAITAATELGVLYGFSDGTFRPDAGVSRTELALALTRVSHVQGASEALPQLSAGWKAQEISFAAGNGWVMGFDGAVFRPDDALTRAEFMQIFNRLLGRTPASLDGLCVGMELWSDNADTRAWYFLDVQEASVSHTAEETECGEWWTALG